MNKRKPQEKIDAIKRTRMGAGYYAGRHMVDMFHEHGIDMTRQSYSNKETGASKFTVDEIRVLSKVFKMPIENAIRLFNDWD